MTCQIEAKVLAHSIAENAPPLVTFQLRYPRIIHSEFMTHRVYSRNARSSRAVPVPRMIAEVRDAPFVPRYWGANQKGMQAGAEHEALVPLSFIGDPCYVKAFAAEGKTMKASNLQVSREEAWLQARDWAVHFAQAFHDAGYHKQVVNRLLEPFTHIDVVVTGTQWSNFFTLRDHEMAEPHIRDLARAMKRALADFEPIHYLSEGDWHTPYVSDRDQADVKRIWDYGLIADRDLPLTAVAVSVTRCAQVSYTPFHEAKLTVEQEVARHDQLVSAVPMHASPAEHQATPDPDHKFTHLAGNLGPGWIQYRKTLAGECS